MSTPTHQLLSPLSIAESKMNPRKHFDQQKLDELASYFWSRVDKGDGSGCWIWPHTPTGDGYGRVYVGGKKCMLGHRVAWILTHDGELDPHICVLHRCDVRACVRPDHLFIGDRGDNARDMAAKGRCFRQKFPAAPRVPKERFPRGERHGNSKISDFEAEQLCIWYFNGYIPNKRDVAKIYGVSPTTIANILHGVVRKHLRGPIGAPNPKYRRASCQA